MSHTRLALQVDECTTYQTTTPSFAPNYNSHHAYRTCTSASAFLAVNVVACGFFLVGLVAKTSEHRPGQHLYAPTVVVRGVQSHGPSTIYAKQAAVDKFLKRESLEMPKIPPYGIMSQRKDEVGAAHGALHWRIQTDSIFLGVCSIVGATVSFIWARSQKRTHQHSTAGHVLKPIEPFENIFAPSWNASAQPTLAMAAIAEREEEAFTLPELPWNKGDLVPHMSAETVEYHHGKHHQAYVTKLNELLSRPENAHWKGKSLEQIIQGVTFVSWTCFDAPFVTTT